MNVTVKMVNASAKEAIAPSYKSCFCKKSLFLSFWSQISRTRKEEGEARGRVKVKEGERTSVEGREERGYVFLVLIIGCPVGGERRGLRVKPPQEADLPVKQ